jgi:hypothetical protein
MKKNLTITQKSVLIIILAFIGLLYWIGLFRFTCKEYIYSKDGKNCITVIQYNNYLKTIFDYNSNNYEHNGIYIIPKKFNGYLPKKNYIYIRFGIGGHYIKWEGDTTIIVLPNTHIIDNKLDSTNVVYRSDFTKDEKQKYNYHNSESNKEFWDYVHQEYIAFTEYDLKKW